MLNSLVLKTRDVRKYLQLCYDLTLHPCAHSGILSYTHVCYRVQMNAGIMEGLTGYQIVFHTRSSMGI